MQTKRIQLTSEDIATIRLALLGWEVRSQHEAKMMREWSNDETLSADARAQCLRNAAASSSFAVEARALLNSGKLL